MWVWEKLSGAQWLDAWEDRFRGDPNFVAHLLKGGRTVRVEVFCDSRSRAEAIREQFGGRVRELKRRDWQRAPEPGPPLKIRDRLLVTQAEGERALRRLAREHPGREVISIPPEMAFGTGEHATTASCLRMLVDIARGREPGWSCIDLGCGSGVLAIAARKLGAGRVEACDFDPLAVKVCRRNLERHGIGDVRAVERDVLRWRPREAYEVVLANLFSSVLMEALPVLARLLKPGGELVLSGILASQAWELFEVAARQGFGFPKVVRKGKWVSARGGWMRDLAS